MVVSMRAQSLGNRVWDILLRRHVLLVGLLALNAFLLAGLAAFLLHRPHGMPDPMEIADEAARGLPVPDAATLRAAFAERSAELQRGHREVEAFSQQVRTVLAEPVFDAQAMQRVFDAGRLSRDAMHETIGAALLKAASQMSPEGRQRLAEWHPPGP